MLKIVNSLFNGINLGFKRLIWSLFLIGTITLLAFTLYYTIEISDLNTKYTWWYLSDDPYSKAEYDRYNYLKDNKDFYSTLFYIFAFGYLPVVFFILWLRQGFLTTSK